MVQWFSSFSLLCSWNYFDSDDLSKCEKTKSELLDLSSTWTIDINSTMFFIKSRLFPTKFCTTIKYCIFRREKMHFHRFRLHSTRWEPLQPYRKTYKCWVRRLHVFQMFMKLHRRWHMDLFFFFHYPSWMRLMNLLHTTVMIQACDCKGLF